MNSFQEDKEGVHYVDEYFHNPPHKISVIVVGAGGTGSHLLTTLARMNAALINLDYPGFHVTVWDDDEVSESNIGRQNFATEDIGLNKAEVITTRINRFFGFDWDVIPKRYTPTIDNQSNIIISCVDNIATRRKIYEYEAVSFKQAPWRNMYYWLDFGNTRYSGQAILSTKCIVEQPKSKLRTLSQLPDVKVFHPDLIIGDEDDTTPSCSTYEALMSQDLLVNNTLVLHGMGMLWKLIRNKRIHSSAVYVNTEKFSVKSSSF